MSKFKEKICSDIYYVSKFIWNWVYGAKREGFIMFQSDKVFYCMNFPFFFDWAIKRLRVKALIDIPKWHIHTVKRWMKIKCFLMEGKKIDCSEREGALSALYWSESGHCTRVKSALQAVCTKCSLITHPVVMWCVGVFRMIQVNWEASISDIIKTKIISFLSF